jgi:hypothetical protein
MFSSRTNLYSMSLASLANFGSKKLTKSLSKNLLSTSYLFSSVKLYPLLYITLWRLSIVEFHFLWVQFVCCSVDITPFIGCWEVKKFALAIYSFWCCFFFLFRALAHLQVVATPLWRSVRMKLTLPKLGLGSPPRLPKLQSSIARVKTPRIRVFFISLEIYWSVNVENGLVWAIWTFAAQVMAKIRVGNQTGSLTPNH